jgi:hypothetical protein
MDSVESNYWVIVIPVVEANRAGRLQRLGDVEVLLTDAQLWFRGRVTTCARTPSVLAGELRQRQSSRMEMAANTDAELDQKLLQLVPGVRPYLLRDDGQLTRLGERVPSGRLPEGEWIPLGDWLSFGLPWASANETSTIQPVTLSLVRCFDEVASNMLLTRISTLAEYVATAPAWRIERLAFAAESGGQALVRGTPLLPIPGEQWVERDGIATLAGWTWAPAIDARILQRTFGMQQGDIALLEADQWHKILAASWVQLSRSAVRSTLENIDVE